MVDEDTGRLLFCEKVFRQWNEKEKAGNAAVCVEIRSTEKVWH